MMTKVRRTGRRGTERRSAALALIASAQFALVLDLTIVTVALPTIQRDLQVAQGQLQWLVSGYALTFGGFLLLAGRAADVFGRLRMFVAGVLVFGAASLAAGLAVDELMLVAARAGQGLGAAAVSPAALALLTTTFREGVERNRALGVFGAVASAGGASGLLLGGVITQWAGWRWIFLVNVPMAAAAAIAAPLIVPDVREVARRRLDVAGAVSITLTLMALIFGLTRGDQAGYGDPAAMAGLAAALALGATFVLAERRSADPLIPIRLLRSPTLVGTDLTSSAVSALVAAIPFFLTLYMQGVLDLSPVATGLAFLPMAVTIMATSALVARHAQRIGVRRFLLLGLAALIGASLLLCGVSADGSYPTDVLPGMLLFGVGLAASYTSSTIGGTAGVRDADQGVAGGLLNTFNQVGGAVGLAVLASVATSGEGATAPTGAALVDGLRAAFGAGLGFAALGVLTVLILVRAGSGHREPRAHVAQGDPPLDVTPAGCLAALCAPVGGGPPSARSGVVSPGSGPWSVRSRRSQEWIVCPPPVQRFRSRRITTRCPPR